MAAEGADIIVNYRSNKTGAEKTAEAIRQVGREVLIVQGDVGNKDDVRKLFDEIGNSFGKLDILVNNAGITPKKSFEQTSENDWDRIIDTNLKSIFLCCKEVFSTMASGGSILNISSIHAFLTTYNFSAYAASKGGMEALTRALAIEFGPKNIRVNALRVGWIVTEREPFGPDEPSYADVCARIPLHRVGQVEDVAPTCIHLCCEDSSFITGQVLGLDGGVTAMINSPYPKGFVDGGALQE